MDRNPSRGTAQIDDVLIALLLPIVSLAVGSRLGADRFVRAAKRAYVRAAINEAFPGDSKVNYSRLAVITGLTRKEVSVLVGQIEGVHRPPIKASREQRALGVVRGWRMDPRFLDEKGRPAELPLRSGRRTFASLVRAYARDVTPMSVLSELERLKVVSKTKSSNALRLLPTRVHAPGNAQQSMVELARMLGDFVNTVSRSHAVDAPPVFFSFRDSSLALPQQAARFERVFSNRASALLDGFDQWIASQPRRTSRASSQARVGLGVYLVHDVNGRQARALGGRRTGKRR
jgi:hypothetical protein